MSERIPYTSRTEKCPGGPTFTQQVERHESFGLVGVNRISSTGTRMFGSHLDQHGVMFRFTLLRAKRVHTDLIRDRIYEDYEAECPRLVEFELTAAQFVELMTSLNVGQGVPCTLVSVAGVEMEEVPEAVKSEAEMIHEKFTEDMRDVATTLRPMTDEIEEVLSAKSITKAGREKIRNSVFHIVKKISDSAPYAMRSFTESAGRRLAQGKAELDAIANTALMRAGLKALTQGDDSTVIVVEPKQLTEGAE